METASVTEKAGSHAIEVGSHHDISSPEISPTSRNKDWGTIMAICIPMALICFFIWLDEAILATAIPRVSDEFQSFAQIGWYGPSYLFGLCASQLPFGRAYKDSPSKITYLFSLFVFEVASIVQGAAPSSEAFIAGRIFAGIGGSGVLTGTLTIFSEEISKARLPYVMGIFGFIHSLGGIAGPVIGGAITTSSLTWRWCFYLNPIISFVAVIPILVLWRGKFLSALDDGQSSTKIALLKFDYLGILSFAAAIVALLLGLQLGSSNQSWSDGRTIAVLTLAIVLMLIFAAVEWWKGDNAILPKGIAGERVVLLSSIYTATLDGAYFVLAYQIPLWFQSISGLSARTSGLRIIPLLASCILATTVSTAITGKLRYYHPFMLLGAVLLTAGSGALTTLQPGAPSASWIGFQILAGVGTGLGTSLPLLAVRDTLPLSSVSIGYSLVLTAGYLASSISLAIAQDVFVSRLRSEIQQQLPGVDPETIINAKGTTGVRGLLPSEVYEQGLHLYNTALTRSWYISVVLAGVSIFLVLGFKWKKMDMRDKK